MDRFATALLLCLPPLAAQDVAGSFAPNPVAPGVPVTLTCTDATGQGVSLPSPCNWYRIFAGSQTGPEVQLGGFCGQIIVPIAANGTFSFTWDQRDANGQLVQPGVYWVRTFVYDAAFAPSYDWFCISIQPAGQPSLTAAGPARLGQNLPLQIDAPGEPGAIYVAAASLTSNNPVVVPGLDICLDQNFVIGPFNAPVGGLDGSGRSVGLELLVPAAPIALYQSLKVQALLFGATGLQVTNGLSFAVQP